MCMNGTYCHSRKFWEGRVWEITDVRSSPLRLRVPSTATASCVLRRPEVCKALRYVCFLLLITFLALRNTNGAPVVDFKHENSVTNVDKTSQIQLVKVKVKCTFVQALRLCTGRTAHRGSRGIALLFHDHGARRGWGVSFTPRPLFTPEKDPVHIVQEAEWPQGRSGQVRQISPPPEFDPWTFQPIANRYTDWAIPAHQTQLVHMLFIYKGSLKLTACFGTLH